MIEWIEATDESLEGVNEELLILYLNARGRYISDIAYPYPQLNVGHIWFCKRDGYALANVKYWSRINWPPGIFEHNDRNISDELEN